MIEFRQHMPGFCDFEPWKDSFNTLEELLDDPRLQSWKKHPQFEEFARSGEKLMAVMSKRSTWWVVGYVDDPAALAKLPEWRAK